MHRIAPALLVAAALALPLAGADQEQDATIGLNLGFVAPGIWDIFTFATPGGAATLTLTWTAPAVCQPPLCVFADYDLRLYRPNAYDDDDFDDHEIIAQSSQHPYRHHSERIDVTLAPATYWVVVAPFQAQLEKYTLVADPGDLVNEGYTFGYQTHHP